MSHRDHGLSTPGTRAGWSVTGNPRRSRPRAPGRAPAGTAELELVTTRSAAGPPALPTAEIAGFAPWSAQSFSSHRKFLRQTRNSKAERDQFLSTDWYLCWLFFRSLSQEETSVTATAQRARRLSRQGHRADPKPRQGQNQTENPNICQFTQYKQIENYTNSLKKKVNLKRNLVSAFPATYRSLVPHSCFHHQHR